MEKLKKYIKREMDVDFLACVHGMSLVFIYGFLLYINDKKDVSYAVIFEMFVAGYIIAWTQKLLFLKEKAYGKLEFGIKAILWCLIPNIECFVAARIFDWYCNVPTWVEPVFYAIMLSYYIIVFWSVRTFYREETKEMNQLLSAYKRREHNYERSNTGK